MLFLLFSVFSGDFLRFSAQISGRGLRGSRNERMRIAGLRGAEAAARTTLRVAKFTCVSQMFADGGELREPLASCSPPRWSGGELRDSESRNTYL